MKIPKDRVAVKICGITNFIDASAAVEVGADFIGLNTWKGTPRYVDLASNKDWITDLPIARVALLVNTSPDEAARVANLSYIDALQLHGDEDASFCKYLATLGKPIIKAIRVNSVHQLDVVDSFSTPHILLDAHVPGSFGGTGKLIDLNLAREFRDRFPSNWLWLAGGLTSENVAEAIAIVRPQVVDVSSGVEASPGRKHVEKMRDFVAAVRGT